MIEISGHNEALAQQEAPLEVRIGALVNEFLVRDDLFLVGVSIKGQKGSRLIEIYIDGDDGVEIAVLASISRELAFVLDAEDMVKGKYRLNVSTPGVDRALTTERQFVRHIGKRLEILVRNENGGTWIEGENLGMKDHVLQLKTSSDTRELSLDSISKAKIKLPW